MRIDLTDEEVATIMVALDSYGAQKRIEWLDSRDDADLTEAGSSEWCWQKIYGHREEQLNNSVADAIGEGDHPNNQTSASIDPFTLPTRTD